MRSRIVEPENWRPNPAAAIHGVDMYHNGLELQDQACRLTSAVKLAGGLFDVKQLDRTHIVVRVSRRWRGPAAYLEALDFMEVHVATELSEHSAVRRPSRAPAFLALLTPVPALSVGAYVMSRSGVASSLWLQNLTLGAILAVLCVALGFAPASRRKSSVTAGAAVAGIALLLLGATLAQAGVDGVRRWLPLGPLRLHVASVALPVLIIATANRRRLRRACAVIAAVILLIQPDAAQATAFAVAATVLFLSLRPTSTSDWFTVAAVAACAVAVWFRYDPLAPVAHVEGVVVLAAEQGTHWLMAAIIALALLPFPFLALGHTERRPARLAIASYFGAVCVAPLVGAYPVPLIGYGLSPVLGYFIALAWLVRREGAESIRGRNATTPRTATATA